MGFGSGSSGSLKDLERAGSEEETEILSNPSLLSSGPGSSSVSTSPPSQVQEDTYNFEKGAARLYDESIFGELRVKDCLSFLGPGFLITIAYVDPGNFEVDMQAGAQFGSSLLWVLLIATGAGLLVQILCIRLAVTTGRHLSQMCRHEYTPLQSKALWILSELAIIASDIPEVIGTAFALKMLFGIPVTAGILVTSTSAMLFLLLQQLGARVLEIFFAFLVGIISCCFVAELSYVGDHVSAGDVFAGLFSFGYLKKPIATSAYIAVGMLGALVMPHNLFLHSALVLARDKETDPSRIEMRTIGEKQEFHRLNTSESGPSYDLGKGADKRKGKSGLPVDVKQTKLVVFYGGLESALALGFSLFINVAVVIVAHSTVEGVSEEEKQKLIDQPLQNAPTMLKNVLGTAAKTFFGCALLASGLSSTMTGTLAGQYVMEGFVDFNLKPALRAFITRSVAIVPSLLVTIVAGESGSEELIVFSSVVLSFELPFALIPLVKFVCSKKLMGPMVVKGTEKWISLTISVVVILANVFMLGSFVVSAMGHGKMTAGDFLLLAFSLGGGAAYVWVLYKMLTKDVEQHLRTVNPTRFQELSKLSVGTS
ncbi:natural resistance-associated macrophage protein [Chloropicon primus]|uniref:Natural resistance-associated macrophage protein n=1 Tax=Chloropicon primus TaxID=1764295 RepID=A0A5B8MQK8_9CHLO|nr:natural resistance-associated macrophage protein [Chloropicon primus]UPR01865.1 natural resistance-associated macrophage protein [Chloropicon primus]|mmetsp:Transcript_12660/g.35357  ORF Transcript_12660/g.35357 Transcript_12660/m.35357 type:complete len:596 (+) Transcript_12660:196-1983(+)|eukprot:QDZ22641.1 natural resistance-associated macrophage protein [Chloropicon primus]